MKHYLKSIIITLASFYIAFKLIPSLTIGGDPKNYLILFGGLWLISYVAKPIFSLVLLPLNIITFGLLSFIINVAFLFALIKFLPGFQIHAYTFAGSNIQGVIIPQLSLNATLALVAFATATTLSQRILHIIFE